MLRDRGWSSQCTATGRPSAQDCGDDLDKSSHGRKGRMTPASLLACEHLESTQGPHSYQESASVFVLGWSERRFGV